MATYTNLSILQGWLEIDSVHAETFEHDQVVVINGWICTIDHDGLETFFDERHPVVISGRPAEAILAITRKLNDEYPHLTGISLMNLSGDLPGHSQVLVSQGRPFVIAQGKLLTHAGRSSVDIKHISFLGLPWGALNALNELEPVMNRDVQVLMAELTAQEKYQMNQALGVAIRALLALRSV